MKGKSKPNPRLSARYLANRRANESNRRYYYRHKAEFLKKYKNKYIAISDNRLTDVDDDRASLLHRVFRTLGGRPFFYTQVTVQPRIVHIPSYALTEPGIANATTALRRKRKARRLR